MDKNKLQDFRRNLRVIEREAGNQMKGDGECCGVSMAQCHVIMELGSLEKTSISDLAGILRLDKSTLSRTIEGLVQAGLVERSIDSEDRRYMQVSLTGQGRKVFGEMNTACNRLYQAVFRNIPAKMHGRVMECLGLLAGAIQKAKGFEGNACACGTGQKNKR
jgi:DNA-binding MarR family transcriptional regulator